MMEEGFDTHEFYDVFDSFRTKMCLELNENPKQDMVVGVPDEIVFNDEGGEEEGETTKQFRTIFANVKRYNVKNVNKDETEFTSREHINFTIQDSDFTPLMNNGYAKVYLYDTNEQKIKQYNITEQLNAAPEHGGIYFLMAVFQKVVGETEQDYNTLINTLTSTEEEEDLFI